CRERRALLAREIAGIQDAAEPLAIRHLDHGRGRAEHLLERRAIELAANALEHERRGMPRQPDALRRRGRFLGDVIVAAVPAEQRVHDVLDMSAYRGQELAALEVAEVDEDLAHAPARLRDHHLAALVLRRRDLALAHE